MRAAERFTAEIADAGKRLDQMLHERLPEFSRSRIQRWIEDGRVLVTEGTASGSVATVRSDTHNFVVWGTQRRPWTTLTTIDGDADYAGRILDVVKVI